MALRVLRDLLGHQDFRPHQEECIQSLLRGADLLAVLPTGGGKSAIYQIPAIVFNESKATLRCLVVSPLISLITDQVDSLNRKLCVTATGAIAKVTATVTGRPVASRLCDAATPFVFITPERLRSSPDLVGRLALSLIVVDEAHCISAHGLAFREDYRDLSHLRQLHPAVPICALTATASQTVRNDIVASLGFRVGHSILCAPVDRSNLKLSVAFRRSFKDDMAEVAQRLGQLQSIVYFQSRDDVEKGTDLLGKCGVQIAAYHAGLPAKQRQSVQDRFVSGNLRCIAATIAFGMGIDVPSIRCVVHYGLPGTLENYLQEIGRAGRDGAPAECRLYWSSSDASARSRLSQENIDPALASRGLRAMLDFAQTSQCLRRHLAAYFEDADAISTCKIRGGQPCNKCLDDEASMLFVDYSDLARCLLKTIRLIRTGATKQLDYHCGKSAAALSELRARHDGSQFAAGGERPLLFWKALHERLREGGYVHSDEHGVCFVTPLGREALEADVPIVLPEVLWHASQKPMKRKASVLEQDLCLSSPISPSVQ